MSRVDPRVTVRRLVRNQSSRNGVKPRLIVVHATESGNRPGDSDLAAIGTWFDNPASQASSHVCTDADGHSGRFVLDAHKAWHCAGFNSVSLGI
jgi:N-acetyl-anhydromuramyl-L-alanine amidase AmpD